MATEPRRFQQPATPRRWIQRVRRVGNSLVVTVPREAVETLGLAAGQFVGLQIEPLELRPRLRPAVQAAFDASWDEHADIYQELARR